MKKVKLNTTWIRHGRIYRVVSITNDGKSAVMRELGVMKRGMLQATSNHQRTVSLRLLGLTYKEYVQ